MHTFKGESCTIHYNGDLSGEFIITKVENDKVINEIRVDTKDILELLKSEGIIK